MSRTGAPNDVEALVGAKQAYLDVFNDSATFQKLKTFRDEADRQGLDRLTSRRLDRVYQAFVPYQIGEDALRTLVRKEAEIENTFNTFRSDFEGSKVSDNDLRQLLSTERDLQRRKKAWEASKQVGAAVAQDLIELVELRNREARRLGYGDYYELMLETSELSEDWLFALLDDLEDASTQAFAEVKTGLDASLRERFAFDGREAWPWLYSDPFFQELPSAGITEALDRIFSDLNIEAVTSAYYGSLGLAIDDLVEKADLYERAGKSQHAFCLDIDRSGDVRVLCNIKPDERWMSTMLHEFGHAVYDKYNDPELPFSLREPAHVFTTEAVAMLNGRMTKTPAWLVRFASVSGEAAREIGPAVFEGMRTSMLIFLRWALTLIRFERELYRNPAQDLASLWWKFVSRIQMITPPVDTSRPDWASKIHLAVAPVYYQNYVLGELMASQVLAHIEHKVAPGGDIFTPHVGDYLVQSVFKPGARWHWNEMLARATGEELSPQHFLSQFRMDAGS